MNKKFAVFQELKNSEITNTYAVHCAFYSKSISRKIEFEIVRQNKYTFCLILEHSV